MTVMVIATIREGVFEMVEFVTKHGQRFPVVEGDGNYYAVTDGYGTRWITPSVYGSGYVISVDGSPIMGTLRVKAPIRRFAVVRIYTLEMAQYLLVSQMTGDVAFYFGKPYKVVWVDGKVSLDAPYGTAKIVEVESDA